MSSVTFWPVRLTVSLNPFHYPSDSSPDNINSLLMAIYSPNLALREPLTLTAVLPLLLSYYAQAVLAILPNTFIFKLMLLPFILWQGWRCIVGFDCALRLAQLFGHQKTSRLAFWNYLFVVRFSQSWIPPRNSY